MALAGLAVLCACGGATSTIGDTTTTTLGGTTTSTLPSTNTNAIPTFESLGLYWTPPSDPGAAGCQVQYRKSGDAIWKRGLAMWYDSRNSECRGSLVQVTPDTSYDVRFSMPGQSPIAALTAKTWSEDFPIAQTVYVTSSNQTLDITQGGTANGYVLYTPAPGSQATIDVANASQFAVRISAPYVIVRGLNIKGGQQDDIRIEPTLHDVVIEDNDISLWGRYASTNSAGWQIGVDMDAGIAAWCGSPSTPDLVRVIIQRNKIHDPRYGANSWSDGHPEGPHGVTFIHCGGNHVMRHNEIYASGEQHYFNDGLGGGANFSTGGFPNSDSDIYGNIVKNAWDDAIEAEGGNRNVRIWGNYIDQTATGVATTIVATGPMYVFRNVYNRSRMLANVPLDQDQRNVFAKSGSDASLGRGRRYLFHNTVLQAAPPPGTIYPLGAGVGVRGTGRNEPITNTITRNNILHVWKDSWPSIDQAGPSNDFDYDLYNGVINYAGAERHGILGTPIYQPGNGPTSDSGGMYQLDRSSPGYDAGVRIPNFNDDFVGAGPDVGAHEAGSPPMRFGLPAKPGRR